MALFELTLETRRGLVRAGFGGVDASLRAAAVELEFYFFLDTFHWVRWSDGGARHYTNFLAWADTTAVGIDEGIRRSGNHDLASRWNSLGNDPLREHFRKNRHQALKHRRDVAPFRSQINGDIVMWYRSFDDRWPGDVLGQSTDFLFWLRDKALPLLLEAISLGARGDDPPSDDAPITKQMEFPHDDPWTPGLDPELALLMSSETSESL